MYDVRKRETTAVNFLAWLVDQNGQPISYYFGKPVYSCDVGDDTGPGDVIREKPVDPFTFETNLLLVDYGNEYIAYPTSSTRVVPFPGYREPIDIRWGENERRNGVVYVLKVEGFPDIPVFPGEFSDFETLTPDPKLTSLWKNPPQPDEVYPVRIGYKYSRDRKLIAKAFPVVERKEICTVEETRLHVVEEGSLFIPGIDTDVLEVSEQDGVYMIRFAPRK